jgi:hypothetical protein
MVIRKGDRWERLESQQSKASLQLFADVDHLGTFAAAGPPHPKSKAWIAYAAAALGVAGGIVGYLGGRRSGRKRGARGTRHRLKRWLSR